ncbi:MAG: thiolase family protein [Chlamydiae bacterium]|nr:thiolase family protein [Chlamydiota bacterium]MBI3276386.1 thiolase family protein [Chlamydiota bacterium]
MEIIKKRIVLACGMRTPIGHINKSLADLRPDEMGTMAIRSVIEKAKIDPKLVDGVLMGWVGQLSNAPNIARVCALNAGMSEQSVAFTLHVNCVSGIEAVASAARQILVGEGELFIAGGTESMSSFPYTIRGARRYRGLKTLNDVKKNWNTLLEDPHIEIGDCMLEGLRDPVKGMIMAETAEILAQLYDISRDEQDHYAVESYRRAIEGIRKGVFKPYVSPVIKNGTVLLSEDENPLQRENFVLDPEKAKKAPALFDNEAYPFKNFWASYGHEIRGKKYIDGKTHGTITAFNSCPRSDGAAAVIVTTDTKAKELGLDIIAELKSWGFTGVNPALMGVGPTFATEKALERAKVSFDKLDILELHEAFAAGCLAIFKVGQNKFGHHWQEKWKAGQVNPYGGSIALGHPLAASGTRILLNLGYELKASPKGKLGLAAACAAGGVSGSAVLEKYEG